MRNNISKSSLVLGILAFVGLGFLSYQAFAQFVGPCGAAGSCSGVIGVDTKTDVGIGGNATTTSRLFVQASTTAGTYSIFASGTLALSSSTAIRFGDGTTQTTAYSGVGSTLSAANISFGAFGSNTGGGNYSFPASLAIGTTTPDQALTVQGTNATIHVVSDTNNTGTLGIKFSHVNVGTQQKAGIFSVYNGSLGWGRSDFYIALDSSADSGNVSTTTDVKFTILNGGNVGIGTTTPGYPLAVQGTIYSSTGGFRFPDGTTQTTAAGGSATTSAANISSGAFGSNTGGGTYSFPAGVGIGTTTPDSASGYVFLDVGTTGVNSGAVQVKNSSGSIKGYMTTASTGVYMGARTNHSLGLLTNDTTRLTVTTAGNVGIATTTPGYVLDVYGDIGIKNGSYLKSRNASNGVVDLSGVGTGSFGISNGVANIALFGLSTNTNGFQIGGTAAGISGGSSPTVAMTFNVGSAERVRIDTNGNVGIGTTTPRMGLYVVGSSTITGTLTVGATGTGKINVGTVDPIYTIDKERYATYLPGMTGQKEETVGSLSCQLKNGSCRTVIDFKALPKGSDLWLFGKATNILSHFSRFTVQLTPSFEGSVWYEKDMSQKTLTIFAKSGKGSGDEEISYRLTAPRFDAVSWTNLASEGTDAGFNLDDLLKQ